MHRRIFILVSLLFFISGICPAEKKRIPLEDYVYTGKGSGRPVTAYRYFRNIADAAGGIAVVSSPLFEGGDQFLIPELYAPGENLEDTVKNFCRLFPVYRYRFIRSILNVYPVKSLLKVYGNGKLLTPDRWITEGAALIGEKRTGVWEPVPGHAVAGFKIPLFRKKGDDSIDAAKQFCRLFPAYEFRRRGRKIYFFPRGDWPRVAKKYNEPLIDIDNGFTVTVGLGAYLHGGYIFRFNRFFVEPRIGFGVQKIDDADDKEFVMCSLNGGWFFIHKEVSRWYLGLSLVYLNNNENAAFTPAFILGAEVGHLFSELTLNMDSGTPQVRIGAGWRF